MNLLLFLISIVVAQDILPKDGYLYHWCSFQDAAQYKKELKETGTLPVLKKIGNHYFEKTFGPALNSELKGIYASPNAISLAQPNSHQEVYGNGEVLIRLKINPAAKVHILNKVIGSDEMRLIYSKSEDLPDVILNRMLGDKTHLWFKNI